MLQLLPEMCSNLYHIFCIT